MAEAQLPNRSAAAPLPTPVSAGELDLAAAREILEDQVRARPLVSLAIALGLGFLLGRLLRS